MNQASSRSFDFGIHYQRSLVHRLLSDKRYCQLAESVIREEVFDSEPLKWCVRQIGKGNRTVRILISELKKNRTKINEDLRKAIVSELRDFLKPYDEAESDYAISELREFVESQDIHECLRDAAVAADEGKKAVEIRDILTKGAYSSASTKSIVVNPITTAISRFNERERAVRAGEVVFTSCGFPNIDADIGGPRLGQLWAFFADTNTGKSQAAISAAGYNLFKGFPVLHFSVEDEISITLQRYDAFFTKIIHDKLTWSKFTMQERLDIGRIFELLNEKRKDFLRVVKVEEGATVPDMVNDYLMLKAQGFRPKVVLVDSPHNQDSHIKMESFRLEQRIIYRSWREFSQQEQVATIVYDQSNQASKGKRADTSAASESYDKPRIVDGFITMNQNKLQKKDGIIELFTAKMKDREKFRSYFVRPNFKRSRFTVIKKEEL